MKAYLDLLQYILENGEEKSDRTNTGTISSFGHQFEFDLEKGFPAVTTKSLAWKGVVSELLWFLEGSDDERRLAEIRFNKDRSELTNLEKYSTIWTDNADKQGKDLGYENNNLKRVRIYPKKSKSLNLAFDVTPAKLVTGLITEKGICEASEQGLKGLFK